MNDAEDTPKTKAVAVKKSDYENAARITAKGKGHLAERILDVAFDKGIKVRSDKDLTNLLEQLDVDSPIPLEALSAVSEILDYVYKANQSMIRNKDQEDVEYTSKDKDSGDIDG